MKSMKESKKNYEGQDTLWFNSFPPTILRTRSCTAQILVEPPTSLSRPSGWNYRPRGRKATKPGIKVKIETVKSGRQEDEAKQHHLIQILVSQTSILQCLLYRILEPVQQWTAYPFKLFSAKLLLELKWIAIVINCNEGQRNPENLRALAANRDTFVPCPSSKEKVPAVLSYLPPPVPQKPSSTRTVNSFCGEQESL